jgi:osmoprotectant transport system substrate-binding protein
VRTWVTWFRSAAALIALAVAGCKSGDSIVVGSKNFSEQVTLGEIIAQSIERTGLRVTRRLNLGGTFVCDRAIRAGEIDVYVEYTGTAHSAILKLPPVNDREKVLEEVSRHYAEAGLDLLLPLGFENTFAMVVRADDAARLPLRTISDLAKHAELRAAFGYEFMERADGFPGLSRTYGIQLAAPPRVMELGLLYRALVDRQADFVAGNSTDGQIASLDLRILDDDKHYFPPYDAVPVVRNASLVRYPELRAAIAPLGGRISVDEMRRLNSLVDGGKASAEEAARELLTHLGTEAPRRPASVSP